MRPAVGLKGSGVFSWPGCSSVFLDGGAIEVGAEFLLLRAARLTEHRRKLRLWAENCPETFASRSILVEAEAARIEGRDDEAMRLFEEAILSARDHGHLHCEAIANERAAGLFAARGRLEVDPFF